MGARFNFANMFCSIQRLLLKRETKAESPLLGSLKHSSLDKCFYLSKRFQKRLTQEAPKVVGRMHHKISVLYVLKGALSRIQHSGHGTQRKPHPSLQYLLSGPNKVGMYGITLY